MLPNKMKNFSPYFFLLVFVFTLPHLDVLGQDTLLVSGKIVAKKEQALENVSVSVEGADIAPVITGKNGEFQIKVPDGYNWLMIQPIGNYKEKRVFLNHRENLLISLSEDDILSGYDEVQIINNIVSRRDIIGAYTQVDLEKLSHKNYVTIDEALAGNVPGLLATDFSGMPGQGIVSSIRGIHSMNANNAPLFILNGMPLEKQGLFLSRIDGNTYSPLTNIDPFDITKITILKDPVLTSVYGTKASNGVILIETLQPKSTQTDIDIGAQTGINLPIEFIPQLNNVQYKSLASEVLSTSMLGGENVEENFPGLFLDPEDKNYFKYLHNTNWQDYVFSQGIMQKYYFNVKGGSEIARYGLSVGYHDQDGIFENTRYNRYNVLFVGRLNIFPKFKMDVNAGLTNNNAYLMESAVAKETSPVYTSLAKAPIFYPFAFDDDGQQLKQIDETDELGISNPYAVVENFKGENKNYRFIASAKGEADLLSSVKLISLFGLNLNTMEEFIFKPNIGMVPYFDGEAHNVSQASNNYLFSFFTNNYLSYTNVIKSIHQLDINAGFRIMKNSFQEDFGETKNLPENDEFTTLQSGQSNLRWIEGQYARWNWLSVYSQLHYKFKNKYLLSASVTSDFSTRTGRMAEVPFTLFNMPFGLFYSAGVGWRISEEDFLNTRNGLENLMLRLSYGTTGNDDIGERSALNYYETTRYRETSGLIPGALPNATLLFETKKELNLGLDLSLWGNRTSVFLNMFSTVTDDLMILEPQPAYMGYKYKPINAGTLRNKGLEISIFQRILDFQNLKWDIQANLTTLSNEITYLNEDELITSFTGGEFVSRDGDPLNTFYGYEFEGVFASYEEAAEANLVNEKGIAFGPGDAKYKDISGPENIPDNVINRYDKINLGSPVPDWFGSISTGLKYKRWSLDAMVQFVYGNELYNYTRYLNERMTDLSNQSIHVLNRWQYEGQVTDVPRALWDDPVGNSDFSSRWIEDGSFIRLKNVTISYMITEEFLVFKNAKFYLTATNLFTLDNYLGYDPEFSYSFHPMQQGIDYGLMPQFRQFLVGVKLGL